MIRPASTSISVAPPGPRTGLPASDLDYEIPREVADALRDVMDEGELRDAFIGRSLATALHAYDDVTTP